MTIADERLDESQIAALVSRARGGDTESFSVIAEAHQARIFQQAVALCHDPAAAEDLAAETLVEAWRSIHRFNGACRFSTWLCAILLHRYQKMVRKARRLPLPSGLLRPDENDETDNDRFVANLADDSPSPVESMTQQELTARLLAAVGSLSGKHEQVILLRFFEEASLVEIAAVLGVSLGTVKSRLHHALEKLRRMEAVLNLSPISGDT